MYAVIEGYCSELLVLPWKHVHNRMWVPAGSKHRRFHVMVRRFRSQATFHSEVQRRDVDCGRQLSECQYGTHMRMCMDL